MAERNTIASTVAVAIIAQTPVDWSWSASLSALELLGAVAIGTRAGREIACRSASSSRQRFAKACLMRACGEHLSFELGSINQSKHPAL